MQVGIENFQLGLISEVFVGGKGLKLEGWVGNGWEWSRGEGVRDWESLQAEGPAGAKVQAVSLDVHHSWRVLFSPGLQPAALEVLGS